MSATKALGGSFAAIIAMIVAQNLAFLLANALVAIHVPIWACNAATGILYLAITYFFLKLLVVKLLRLEMPDVGIPKLSIKPIYLVVAIALPAAITAIYLLFVRGEYVSSNMDGATMLATLATGIFFTGLAAGFVEEMVFRGVILHLLEARWNTLVAVLVPSLLFGIVHILGMSFTLGSCIQVILAGTAVGIMFSLIAIESGSIWNDGIVHALWNVIMIGGGLTISASPSGDSVMTYVLQSKSFLLTGGEFGVESSLIAILGYVVVAGAVLVAMRRNRKAM